MRAATSTPYYVGVVNPGDLPIDEISRASLAADHLTYGLVDTTDPEAYAAWFRAECRGFLDGEPTTERLEWRHSLLHADDRTCGVWDSLSPNPAMPVATTVCWSADLTVPGGHSLPAWAVSGVTVAPTHRRRGIARALMQAELRTAATLGLPIAMLTVSESTIYGRFGYAPAAMARDVTVLTKRAHWTGVTPPGRVHFVTAEQLRTDGREMVEQVRLKTPGQISYEGVLWDRQLGLVPGDDNAKNLRFIRYDNADGTAEGFAIYHVVENETDFTDHELKLTTLVAATNQAYAGLWRFLLEMDLVSQITAHLRPTDDPLRWMISDFRAVRVSEFDHLWVRILDVPTALAARTYQVAGTVTITVTDPLGFADGTWTIEVSQSGDATVTRTTAPADVTLTVNALGSLYLGGAHAAKLQAAGQITGDAIRLDGLFRSPVEPYLSIWF